MDKARVRAGLALFIIMVAVRRGSSRAERRLAERGVRGLGSLESITSYLKLSRKTIDRVKRWNPDSRGEREPVGARRSRSCGFHQVAPTRVSIEGPDDKAWDDFRNLEESKGSIERL